MFAHPVRALTYSTLVSGANNFYHPKKLKNWDSNIAGAQYIEDPMHGRAIRLLRRLPNRRTFVSPSTIVQGKLEEIQA